MVVKMLERTIGVYKTQLGYEGIVYCFNPDNTLLWKERTNILRLDYNDAEKDADNLLNEMLERESL